MQDLGGERGRRKCTEIGGGFSEFSFTPISQLIMGYGLEGGGGVECTAMDGTLEKSKKVK